MGQILNILGEKHVNSVICLLWLKILATSMVEGTRRVIVWGNLAGLSMYTCQQQCAMQGRWRRLYLVWNSILMILNFKSAIAFVSASYIVMNACCVISVTLYHVVHDGQKEPSYSNSALRHSLLFERTALMFWKTKVGQKSTKLYFSAARERFSAMRFFYP